MTTLETMWRLLLPDQRRAAAAMMGLMLVGMLLETLGIGMVMPALTLMTHSDLAAKYPVLAPWLNRLGNPRHEQLVIAGMLALVAVYAAKMIFFAFLAWWQGRFVFGLQVDLSQRLFAGYLRQPYVFHLQRNSAQLIRSAIGQVDDVTYVIQQGLILLTEFLLLFGVSVLLLTVESLGAALVISTLGLAGWAFNHFARNKISGWGQARQYHEGLRLQHLQEGLGAVKDVKVLGRETEFLARYRLHSLGSAKVGRHQAVLQALPRLWLEFLAVIGLAGLVLVMIGQGKSLETLLPTLGLFAAAAFRLMPSVTRVLGALQGVRFYFPAINNLHNELLLLKATAPPTRGVLLPYKKVLTLDQVSFCYPSSETFVLSGINLSIACGASVGFVGGSGAGKSTLVDIILGLFRPTSGRVTVDGADIHGNLRGWQDQVGYVSQTIFLTDDTLRRNVAFGLSDDQIDESAVWRAIRAAQLEQFVSEQPEGLNSIVGERGVRLSGGQRQRIGIARALYHDPSVLVLDEATSSLDIATERNLMNAVYALRRDKTILIVAHRLSTVEHCDRLYRLEDGRLVQEGGAAAVLGSTTGSGASISPLPAGG